MYPQENPHPIIHARSVAQSCCLYLSYLGPSVNLFPLIAPYKRDNIILNFAVQ